MRRNNKFTGITLKLLLNLQLNLLYRIAAILYNLIRKTLAASLRAK